MDLAAAARPASTNIKNASQVTDLIDVAPNMGGHFNARHFFLGRKNSGL